MQARRPTRFDRRFVVMIFVRHAFYFSFFFWSSIGVPCVLLSDAVTVRRTIQTPTNTFVSVCAMRSSRLQPACGSRPCVCVTNADTNLLLSSDPMLAQMFVFDSMCHSSSFSTQTCVLGEQHRERIATKSNIHCNRVLAIQRFRYKNSPNRKICTQLSCDIERE